MSVPASPKVVQLFLHVLRARAWIAGAFLLLAAAGIYGALRVPDDPAIDRLIVANDPVALATRDFDRLFPEGAQALIMLETPDPLSLATLRAADGLERGLAKIPHVAAHSLLDFHGRAGSAGEISPIEAESLRTFASGTPLFRRAGLLGDHYFGIALELGVNSPEERDRALAAIDALALPLEGSGGPVTKVRRVGSPWLDAWLERQTGAATARFMPLFGVFLMALVLIIYRSWRALAAIILTLGALVAMAMGLAHVFGWSHTVISTLVPLTVMVTTTATLVYVHSRYIEPDDSPTLLEHHARALANKFLPCTASMFATAVGFAALAISEIRPVREMGLWTASGLIVAWIGCFTLFPALQSLLRTPMRSEQVPAGKWFPGFVDKLVPASRRFRWPLVGGALVLMLCGAAALFGVPGVFAPIALEMDVLTYVNPSERVAQDTRQFEQSNGLDVVELWLQTPPGHALDPDFLRALEQLTRRLESDPRITAVDGPTSVLRWARYVQTGSDQLPTSASAWPKLASDLEQIMLTEPGARAYVDVADLANVRMSIRGRAKLFGRIGATAPHSHSRPKLRTDGERHFSRVPGGVSQSLGHVDDDDSLAVRHPVRVSGDALGGHSAQHRDDPHRLDGAGLDRERPDSLFLPFSGGPLGRHDSRRSATRLAGRRPPDCVCDPHQRQRLSRTGAFGPAADARVRHRFRIGVRPRVARRFHGIAGRVVDSEPI